MTTESPEELKKIAETWADSYNGHAIELKKKRLLDRIESPELLEAQQAMKEATEMYSADNEKWWNNLSEEERERAFYAVCKRIHKADIEKNSSYRYTLYQVFGFDMSMYSVGMDCGYIDIHNNIYGGITLNSMTNAKTIQIRNKNSTQTIQIDDDQKVLVKLKEDDSIIDIEIKDLPKTYDNNI